MTAPERPLQGRTFIMAAARQRLAGPGSGVLDIAIGFGVALVIGTLLLLSPFVTESGHSASPLEALFTATSAICVTGLTVVDTPTHWNTFGQVIVIALVQVGGLGYMLGTSVILWAMGRRLGLHDQNMLRLYYGAPSMRETLSFARAVGLFTLAFESVGAVLLALAFLAEGAPLDRAVWWGLFHSISAFNNSGFTITGADLTPYTGNPLMLLTICVLVIAGGLGFIPIAAIAQRRSFSRLPLDSKLIVATSLVLLFVGTLFFAAFEWTNEATLGELPSWQRPLAAFFHSTASRSAGFGVVDVGAMREESKIATIGLMFVGGAAGSTAGGLKVGAFAMLFAVMVASLRGREEVIVFRRRLPVAIIQQATTLALYYVALVFVFTMALTFASETTFIDVLFEAVSGIGTVGYTAAGTVTFGSDGHVILLVAMILGRFSPIMLVLYMSRPRKKLPYRYPPDSVRLG